MIFGQGTGFHILQLKILPTAMNIKDPMSCNKTHCSQINNFLKIKITKSKMNTVVLNVSYNEVGMGCRKSRPEMMGKKKGTTLTCRR